MATNISISDEEAANALEIRKSHVSGCKCFACFIANAVDKFKDIHDNNYDYFTADDYDSSTDDYDENDVATASSSGHPTGTRRAARHVFTVIVGGKQ